MCLVHITKGVVVLLKFKIAFLVALLLLSLLGCSKKDIPILYPNPEKYFDTNLPSMVGIGQRVPFYLALKNLPSRQKFDLRISVSSDISTESLGVIVIDGVEFNLTNATPILLMGLSKDKLSCVVQIFSLGNTRLHFSLDAEPNVSVDRLITVRDNQLLPTISTIQTSYPYKLHVDLKSRSFLVGDVTRIETRLTYTEEVPGALKEKIVVSEFSSPVPPSQLSDLVFDIDRSGVCDVVIAVTLDTSIVAQTDFNCLFTNNYSPEFVIIPQVNTLENIPTSDSFTTDNQFGYRVSSFGDLDGYVASMYYKIQSSYLPSHQTDWVLFWSGGDTPPQISLPTFPELMAAGSVVVAIKAVDNGGNESVKSHTWYIRPALNPVAKIERLTASTKDYIGDSVVFTGASSSCETTRAIVAYDWRTQFVDIDGISQEYALPSSAVEVSLPLHALGTVTVFLTVTDNYGLSDTTSYSLFVSPNIPTLNLHSLTQDIDLVSGLTYHAYEQDAQRFKYSVLSTDLLKKDFLGIKPVVRYMIRGLINNSALIPTDDGIFPDFYLFSTSTHSRLFTLSASLLIDGIETNLTASDYGINVKAYVPIAAKLANVFPVSLPTNAALHLDASVSVGRNNVSIDTYTWRILGSVNSEVVTTTPYLTINDTTKLPIEIWKIVLSVKDQNNNVASSEEYVLNRINTPPSFDNSANFHSVHEELPSKKSITLFAPASDVDIVVGDYLRYSYYCYDGEVLVSSVENITDSSHVFDFENLSYTETKTYTSVIVVTDNYGGRIEKKIDNALTLDVRFNNTPVLSNFKASYTAPLVFEKTEPVLTAITSKISLTPNTTGTLLFSGFDPDGHTIAYKVKIFDFGGHMTKEVLVNDGMIDLQWLVNNKTMSVWAIDQYNAISLPYHFDIQHYSSLQRNLLKEYTVKSVDYLSAIKSYSRIISTDSSLYAPYYTPISIKIPVVQDNAAFIDNSIIQKVYIEDVNQGWILVGTVSNGVEIPVHLSTILTPQTFNATTVFNVRVELYNDFFTSSNPQTYMFTLHSFSPYDVSSIIFYDELQGRDFVGSSISIPAYENVSPENSSMGIYRDEVVYFKLNPHLSNVAIPLFGQQNFRLDYSITHASGVVDGPYTTYDLKTIPFAAKSDFVINYTLSSDNAYTSTTGTITGIVMPKINTFLITYNSGGQLTLVSSRYDEVLPQPDSFYYITEPSFPVTITITRDLFPGVDPYGFGVTTRLTVAGTSSGDLILPASIDTDTISFIPSSHPVVGNTYYITYEMFYTGVVNRYSKKIMIKLIRLN